MSSNSFREGTLSKNTEFLSSNEGHKTHWLQGWMLAGNLSLFLPPFGAVGMPYNREISRYHRANNSGFLSKRSLYWIPQNSPSEPQIPNHQWVANHLATSEYSDPCISLHAHATTKNKYMQNNLPHVISCYSFHSIHIRKSISYFDFHSKTMNGTQSLAVSIGFRKCTPLSSKHRHWK